MLSGENGIGGCEMKEPVTRVGVFFGTLRSCMSWAWKEADIDYHIPKSRFRYEGNPEPGNEVSPSGLDDHISRHHFRGFKSCIKYAWEASDRNYHIPKSRHGNAA